MMPVSLFNHIQDSTNDSLPIIRCTKRTLVHLSHALENIVLQDKIPALIFTGFQESSHWREETKRYEELSGVVKQICIFAGRSLPPEANARQLHIELADGDPMRQEWFLAILSEQFTVLLCGQDTLRPAEEEATREFDTLWTFEPQFINPALDALEDAIRLYRPEKLAQIQEARGRFALPSPDTAFVTRLMVDLLLHEEALNNVMISSQKMIDTVLAAVNHVVVVLEGKPDSLSFNRVYSSDRYRALLGRDIPDEGRAPVLNQDLHPEDRDRVTRAWREQPFDEPLRLEFRLRHADGSYLWIEDTMTKRYDARRGVVIVYLVLRDITREREMRENQHRMKQERELDAVKAYFITNVMHEFRTPLATILSSAEIIQRYRERVSEERQAEHISQIIQEVVHLRDVLDDLNIILGGRIEGMGFHPRRLDVAETFQNLTTHFIAQVPKPYRVNVTYGENLGEANLDPRLLRHIILNLLQNAVLFSGEDAPIEINILVDETGYIQLTVKDYGIGIPVRDIPHIYDIFYRASNALNLAGSGMGLHVSAICAKLHGGRLTCESQLGVGTVMALRIPRDYLPGISPY